MSYFKINLKFFDLKNKYLYEMILFINNLQKENEIYERFSLWNIINTLKRLKSQIVQWNFSIRITQLIKRSFKRLIRKLLAKILVTNSYFKWKRVNLKQ